MEFKDFITFNENSAVLEIAAEWSDLENQQYPFEDVKRIITERFWYKLFKKEHDAICDLIVKVIDNGHEELYHDDLLDILDLHKNETNS